MLERTFRYLLLVTIFALLVGVFGGIHGCALVGAPVAQTTNQRLVYAQGVATAAEMMADHLLTARLISSAKAQAVQSAASTIQSSAAAYWATGGTANVQAVTSVLASELPALESFLAANQGK